MSIKLSLYVLHFFSKGWQVSLLVLLPFIQQDLHISLIDIGLLSTVLTVASIFSSFFAGHIHEKLGNKNALLVSILLYVFAWIGFLFVQFNFVLWLIYILGGLSAGLFDPIANAMIAKNAPSTQRGKAIGDYGAFGDLGRIGMTTITTVLAGYITWKSSSVVYGVMAFGLLLLYYFIKTPKNIHVEQEADFIPARITHLLQYRKFVLALIVGILDTFSSVSLFIFLPFLLTQKGIAIASTGLFTCLFFIGFFVGRWLLGRIADKHGTVRVLVISEICMSILIFSLVYISSYWLIITNLFFLGVVTRGTGPIIKSMLADGLRHHEMEKGFSLYSSCVRVAGALSRSLFGFIGAFFGIQSIFFVCGFAALFILIPSISYYKTKNVDLSS